MFKNLKGKLKQKAQPEIGSSLKKAMELGTKEEQLLRELKEKIKQRIIAEYKDFSSKLTFEAGELKELIRRLLEDTIYRHNIDLSNEQKDTFTNDIINEFLGLGPIQSLLKDSGVTEIMINGPKKVYIERQGKTQLSDIRFENAGQLMHLIHRILASTRRRVDESNPYTDVSLNDGSRVNIIIPPLALDGPVVTIRKFLREIRTVDDLVDLGTLDKRMAEFLVACVKAKVNIIFAGATGSGKTTTLNVLSSYVYPDERILTIEDTAELRLSQEHVVRLETRQANIEGRGEVTIRELFRNSLRMRPDRIILGEIRGVEALDMLQAVCSGHTGSLVILHANSPQDAIYRLETMILISGFPITLEAIHRQIAAAVNLVVQQEQLIDGSRKITRITQVNGLKDKQAALEDIFTYEIDEITSGGEVKGRWHATGSLPVFNNLFKKSGISLPEEIFKD